MIHRLVYIETMNIEHSLVWECALSENPGKLPIYFPGCQFPPEFVMIGRSTAGGTEIEHWQLKGTWLYY